MAGRGDTEQKPEAAWFYFEQRFIFTEMSPLCYIISSSRMAVEEQDLPIMGQHKQLGDFSWLPWGAISHNSTMIWGRRCNTGRGANKLPLQ